MKLYGRGRNGLSASLGAPANAGPARLELPRFSELVRQLASEKVAPLTVLTVALAVGALIRLTFVLIGDGFPLNDGGMFLVMVEDLKPGFGLPQYTSYNGGDIPYAYSPLMFYLTAGLSEIGGWSTLDLLRVLPLLFSLLTIAAVYLLAKAMLPSRLMAALAALIFATIPTSFSWMIAGGGLTRSPGFFFAILAIWQAHQLFTSGSRRHLVPASVLGALAILSHLEIGWFAAFSIGLIFLANFRTKGSLRSALLLCFAVLAWTAPWWLSLVIRLGPEPLLAALQTGDHSPLTLLRLLSLDFTGDAFFPVAIGLGLLGLVASLPDQRFLIPVWLLLIFLLDIRKAPTTVTVPLAMLAAYGFFEAVLPLLRQRAASVSPHWPSLTTYAAFGFIFVIYAPIAAFGSALSETSPLHSISAGNRAAMYWARDNTPADARFIVVPSVERWGIDATAEWFPALSQRVSLTTVQGSEWLPGSTYSHRIEAYATLAECGGQTVICLEDWAAKLDFSHIYIAKGRSPLSDLARLGQKLDCCAPLIASLAGSANYVQIFDSPDAAIFQRIKAQ